jgi:rhodanese-related sulfurtransferase
MPRQGRRERRQGQKQTREQRDFHKVTSLERCRSLWHPFSSGQGVEMNKMATANPLRAPLTLVDKLRNHRIGRIAAGLVLVCSVLPIARADDAPAVTVPVLVAEMSSAHPPLVLDVRSPEEYAEGHVPQALNIPHTAIEAKLGRLETYRDRDIVVYCKSGRRAGIALELLKARGFTRLRHLAGDFTAWKAEGRPVEQDVIIPTVPH